ncbi:MAG: cyclase family protein [Dehalococcoidia bacterium]
MPRFAELPVRTSAPAGSSWGVFGDEDEIGAFNLLTPERVVAAARLVRTGRVFPMNWTLLLPSPPLFGRRPLKQGLGAWPDRMVTDDVLHNFYPQVSSQWDALRHAGHRQHGFYNGVTIEQVSERYGGPLAIDKWAERGIAGRGVLLDVAGHYQRIARPLDGLAQFPITRDVLIETAEAQHVDFQPGDILLVRTGWMASYLRLTQEERDALSEASQQGSRSGRFAHPGLAGEELPPFLWDHRVTGVAADNPAFDMAPPAYEGAISMHGALIGLLGIAIGEMWFLEDLAADCAEDGVYEFFLTSAPLNMPGGSGSPPNALAIK